MSIFYVLALFGTAPAFAQSDLTRLATVDQLAAIFSTHMIKLDRPIVTFHYETEKNFFPTSLRDVQKRVVGWPENFFNVDKIVDVSQGPGTYVAIDPAGSRNFGDKKPQLTVFTLKAGTRVFTTGAPITSGERDLINNINQQLKCDKYVELNGLERFVQIFRTSNTVICRELIIAAAKRAGVQAILYDYPSSNQIKGCREREEAFNIISSEAFDLAHVSYYEPGKSFEGQPMKSYLARLYPEAMQDFIVRWNTEAGAGESPFPVSEAAPYPIYRHWKAKNLYKCGTISNAERADDRFDFWTFLRPAVEDRMVSQLLLATKAAFLAHASDDRLLFDATKIALIRRAEAAALGFAMDDRSWAEYEKFSYDASYSLNSPSAFDAFEASIGEQGTYHDDGGTWRTARDWANRLSATERRNPNALYVYYRQLGFGPKLALFVTNKHLVHEEGAPPYLIARPSEILDASGPEIYRRNSLYYRQLLSQCLKIYQTPGITLAEIQGGACAVKQSL